MAQNKDGGSGRRATLTDKQEKFVQELIKGKSQREAYRAAYPKCKSNDKTVDETASILFSVPKVYARYTILHDRLIKEAEDECIVTAKQVIRELANIAFANSADYSRVVETTNSKGQPCATVAFTPTASLTAVQQTAIAGIKQSRGGIEVKQHDKVKALELLGRHLALFVDKQEVDIKDFPQITLKRGE